jgi:hypothetical protein
MKHVTWNSHFFEARLYFLTIYVHLSDKVCARAHVREDLVKQGQELKQVSRGKGKVVLWPLNGLFKPFRSTVQVLDKWDEEV